MKMSKKSTFVKLLVCMLALAMLLSACGGSNDNPGGGNDNPGGGSSQGGGNDNPGGGDAQGTTTRFEAEYATINGSVPGLVSVFFGASNNCMLEPVTNASNGYTVGNCYIEGNDDNLPSITFTITSDAEAEATIVLGVGAGWHMDDSFNTIYDDTDVNTAYPLTFNGTALTTSATIKAADVDFTGDGDEKVRLGGDIIGANYGTVTLKAGENTFTITATEGSRCIDYLEITTTANVTMQEDHSHTYRIYDDDEMEFVEKTID